MPSVKQHSEKIDFFEIPGWPYLYISKEGVVWDEYFKEYVRPTYSDRPYPEIKASGSIKPISIHRALALTYLVCPGDPMDYQVEHKDGNKENYKLDNLEWVTRSENAVRAFRNRQRNDNHRVLLKDLETGTVTEHYSITDCAKPIIAAVNGYALGGGCELAMHADIIIAGENAKFGQTGPRVGSFDAGYGAGYLARMIGHKRAREVWFLCRQYTAAQAYEMGMVNTVVPFDKLEEETVQWCEEILQLSPMALRMLKASFNADTDGLAGLQQFAGDATLMYYTTDEAKEGRDAFKEKRKPDFKQFPKFP